MKTFLFVALLFSNAFTSAFAQPVNELKLMGHRHGFCNNLMELGGSYYYDFAHYKVGPKRSAHMLELYKFNKLNYLKQASAISAGDTIQFDSVLYLGSGSLYAHWNGNIAFVSNILYDTSYHAYNGLRFSLLDTNLNVLIPQRPLKYIPHGSTWTNTAFVGMVPFGDRLAVFYRQTDTGTGPYQLRTCAIILDKDGTILKDTTVVNYTDYLTTKAMPYPGNRFMLSTGRVHVLLDSNLKIVDSFQEKPRYMPSGPYKGYFSDFGYEISLPSGTLIKGGEYSIMQGPAPGKTTALSRLTAGTRFSSDTTVLFFSGPGESPNAFHYNHSLQYNQFDNRVYYSNSLRQQYAYVCVDDSNLVQVICTDTLLRPLWRKFISLGPNICATTHWVAASDGRGGVGVMGYYFDKRFDIRNTAHSGTFLFHLDSVGDLSVNSGPAAIVRDRLKMYPNPATDVVTIDDLLGGLSGYSLYDMSGMRVSSGTAKGKMAKVSLEGLPAAAYVLRVVLTDGTAESQTVLKR